LKGGRGYNSHMYDTPRYNQIKIIGIYTINIYKMITNTHSFNFKTRAHEGQHEQIVPQAFVARNPLPPFNFLFTYLFSIKYLYFFIISSIFLILTCSCQYSYNLMLTATCRICANYVLVYYIYLLYFLLYRGFI
jgi:hypothetical protein